MSKPETNQGGRPVAGEQAATSILHVRVAPRRKAGWVRAAKGEPLSMWVTRTLDQAAAGVSGGAEASWGCQSGAGESNSAVAQPQEAQSGVPGTVTGEESGADVK